MRFAVRRPATRPAAGRAAARSASNFRSAETEQPTRAVKFRACHLKRPALSSQPIPECYVAIPRHILPPARAEAESAVGIGGDDTFRDTYCSTKGHDVRPGAMVTWRESKAPL